MGMPWAILPVVLLVEAAAACSSHAECGSGKWCGVLHGSAPGSADACHPNANGLNGLCNDRHNFMPGWYYDPHSMDDWSRPCASTLSKMLLSEQKVDAYSQIIAGEPDNTDCWSDESVTVDLDRLASMCCSDGNGVCSGFINQPCGMYSAQSGCEASLSTCSWDGAGCTDGGGGGGSSDDDGGGWGQETARQYDGPQASKWLENEGVCGDSLSSPPRLINPGTGGEVTFPVTSIDGCLAQCLALGNTCGAATVREKRGECYLSAAPAPAGKVTVVETDQHQQPVHFCYLLTSRPATPKNAATGADAKAKAAGGDDTVLLVVTGLVLFFYFAFQVYAKRRDKSHNKAHPERKRDTAQLAHSVMTVFDFATDVYNIAVLHALMNEVAEGTQRSTLGLCVLLSIVSLAGTVVLNIFNVLRFLSRALERHAPLSEWLEQSAMGVAFVLLMSALNSGMVQLLGCRAFGAEGNFMDGPWRQSQATQLHSFGLVNLFLEDLVQVVVNFVVLSTLDEVPLITLVSIVVSVVTVAFLSMNKMVYRLVGTQRRRQEENKTQQKELEMGDGRKKKGQGGGAAAVHPNLVRRVTGSGDDISKVAGTMPPPTPEARTTVVTVPVSVIAQETVPVSLPPQAPLGSEGAASSSSRSSGLSTSDMEVFLRNFYQKFHPENVGNVPYLVEKYGDDQDRLWAQIAAKYPEEFRSPATSSQEVTVNVAMPAPPARLLAARQGVAAGAVAGGAVLGAGVLEQQLGQASPSGIISDVLTSS